MHLPPEPNPRELLPPLLACLPTAFMSPRPPPALMPALSPLLRQRVNYMNDHSSNGWLGLLSWDQQRASKLPDVVERMQLEAHPVSGEIEIDELRPAKYRRLDDETLHSRLEVEQFDLCPTFVWCENDEHGETGAGWKLSELRSLEDLDDGEEWFDTPSQATDAANTTSISVPQGNGLGHEHGAFAIPADEEDDDDDYWASYDKIRGETPGQTPDPPANHTAQRSVQRPQADGGEAAYFAQYGSVQPAMDGHDPDEEHPEFSDSSLNGNPLVQERHQQHLASLNIPKDGLAGLHDSAVATALTQSMSGEELSMPRPISPTSSHSSVDKLEEKAAEMEVRRNVSVDEGTEKAQRSIKMHISTDIKSLFRLAKSVGMERSEFEEVVRRELDVLSLLERDE